MIIVDEEILDKIDYIYYKFEAYMPHYLRNELKFETSNLPKQLRPIDFNLEISRMMHDESGYCICLIFL